MTSNRFFILQSFSKWCCEKLNDNEAFDEINTLSTTFIIVMYALNHCVKFEKNNSILIQIETKNVSFAIIQLTQLKKIKIFVIVYNEKNRQWLLKNFVLNNSNVISNSKNLFQIVIMIVINNKNVDVVLNFFVDDAFDDNWKCVVKFDRFVDVEKQNINNVDKFDMLIFFRNTSFISINLNDLYDIFDSMLKNVWQK